MNNYFQEKKDEEKKEEAEKKPAAEAKPKKPLSHVKDYEEDTVYLFQFTRSPQVGLHTLVKTNSFDCNIQFLSISDPLDLSLLSQVGVLAEASRHQVPGIYVTPCPCLWSDQGLQQEACCSAALRPGCCSGLCRLHCSEIIPGETIHALCSAPEADFSRLEDYLCK